MKDTVDITGSKLENEELINYIEGEFNSNQGIVIQPFPHMLKMRRDQFDHLNARSGLYGLDPTEQPYYRTLKGYIMEAHVDESATR